MATAVRVATATAGNLQPSALMDAGPRGPAFLLDCGNVSYRFDCF
jgi:hypothetical protein